jgi:hypothetical protein
MKFRIVILPPNFLTLHTFPQLLNKRNSLSTPFLLTLITDAMYISSALLTSSVVILTSLVPPINIIRTRGRSETYLFREYLFATLQATQVYLDLKVVHTCELEI